jgi:protease-4
MSSVHLRLSAAVLTVAALLPVRPASATKSELPSYYDQINFNLTSPSAWATAVGGFANPAVYGVMPGSEMEFYASHPESDPLAGLSRWGLFTGLGNLGFGFAHTRVPEGDGSLSVTDYRLALSGGSPAHSAGLSLGWSRGDTDQFKRTTLMQLGIVDRPTRYLSVGIAGAFSTENRDIAGLFDLAVRPMGDERLTVFGDLEYPRGYSLKDSPWSLGAMLEIPAGLKLVGRYFDDERFTFGVAYTFGGAAGTGHLRGSVAPFYSSGGAYTGINWGVRMGYPERNRLTGSLFKDAYYVKMKLKGPVVHTRYRFFDSGRTLYALLDGLEGARTDDRVAGVALNLSGAKMSTGTAWELRQKLLDLQAAGKHVVAYIDEAGMATYFVASAADVVVMDPEGMMLLAGYALGRTYAKEMLAKMRLGVEEWRFKDYKSAFEVLSRETMSPADREQRQALVDGWYGTVREGVTASRGVDPPDFDRWVDDVTIVFPNRALEEGIVDKLARWDEIDKVVRELEGRRKGFMGADATARHGYPSRRWGTTPRIAVVYAIGGSEMDGGYNARQVDRMLKAVTKDRRVEAVVLRINSPGGSPLAADVVAEGVRKCAEKKPVIVSQADVAASGGYWASMHGTKILVQPTTITGSIGVIGGWVWDEGLGDKMGLHTDEVSAGEHADLFVQMRLPFLPLPIGIPYRGVTDEERRRILAEMEGLYQRFIAKVAAARDLSEEKVAELAKGRVWTGEAGVANGLVDAVGGLDAAIAMAREEAGIAPDEPADVVEYSHKGWFNLAFNPWSFLTGKTGVPEAGGTDEVALLRAYEQLYLGVLARYNGRPLCLLPPEDLPREALFNGE